MSAPAGLDGFVAHTMDHYVHRLGASPGDPASAEHVARRVRALVDDAGDAHAIVDPVALERRDRAAHELAGDPALLAAFFQNVDLLYAGQFFCADAVSALILRALELSALFPSASER